MRVEALLNVLGGSSELHRRSEHTFALIVLPMHCLDVMPALIEFGQAMCMRASKQLGSEWPRRCGGSMTAARLWPLLDCPYIDEAEEDEHDNDDATVMMVMRTKLVIMVVCMIKMRTRMLMRIVRQG